MEGKFECWAFVPGTDGRFAVSNRGRFMRIAKKRRFGRQTLRLAVNEIVPLVSDYMSGELGWYGFYDGDNHFFGREGLMRVFPESLRDVDCSADEAAVAKRKETYRDFKKQS